MKLFATWMWPMLVGGGLLVAAFSLVPWGSSSEGVRPTVSGLGRVAVAGASPDDVAFLESHTLRPGLVTVALGAVIVVAAALGWAVPKATPIALGVVGLGGLGAVIVAIVVTLDPAGHLFDDAVNDALDDGSGLLAPGYGVIGVLIVGIVMVGVTIAGTLGRVGRRSRTADISRSVEPS